MKQIMFIIGFLLGSFLLFSSFSLRENPQDPPRGEKGKKVKRHIHLEKIENGEKSVLDTVIEGNRVFVWNGDTVGSAKEFNWIGKEGFKLDSLDKNFEFRFFDSEIEGDNSFVFAPRPPKVPHVVRLNKKLHGNVIDLGDPGIISYKKKKMSGGREKITIIRNEPSELDIEEDIVIEVPNVPEPAVWMSKDGPEKIRTVRVIKNDNGEIKVIENEDFEIKKEDEKVMIIRKKVNEETEDVELEIEEKEENE